MKNKLIEQKLNQYAEAVKPDSAIIQDAIFELRQKRQRMTAARHAYKVRRRRSWIAVTAVLVVSVISLLIYSLINDEGIPEPQFYSVTKMSYKVATAAEAEESYGVRLMDIYIDVDKVYTNTRVYSVGDTPVMVSVLYKMVGDGGLDEIVVLADLNGGLTDYEEYRNYTKTQIGGVTVHMKETAENGEYYAGAYFNLDGIDYYMMITSPLSGSANEYISLLLNP